MCSLQKRLKMGLAKKMFLIIVMLIIASGSAFPADKIIVYVSIIPQKYFVEQIGGELVHVHAMVQPGASPATYEPKPKQMAAISKTQVYLAIGVPFENIWLKKFVAANPKMKVVSTHHGIKKIPMLAAHSHERYNGQHSKVGQTKTVENEKNHHGHDGSDPHIWLSPPLVKVQAKAILTALKGIDPMHGNVYEANYEQFVSRITQLDDQLKQTFSKKIGLEFMVFHPAWGYFAQAYGLKQIPIEIEGKTPKPAQLKALIEHAKERNIKVIFVQPQFSAKSATLIAKAIGGQVAFADPLAKDWVGNLQQVAHKFKKASE